MQYSDNLKTEKGTTLFLTAKKGKKHRRGRRKKECSVLNSGIPYSLSNKTCFKNNKIVIRPLDVPKAPENFTQFIIDNHEDSSLFRSFEKGSFSPHWFSKNKEYINSVSPDDELFWEQYSKLDFEATYRTAQIDELTKYTRKTLIEKILILESCLKDLENQFKMCNPISIVLELQSKLLVLQEENKKLRSINGFLNNHSTETNKCDNYSCFNDPLSV